jgi:hypothetical protein
VDRRLEHAAAELRHGRLRTIEYAVLAVATFVAALVSAPIDERIALSLGAAAAVEALLALRTAHTRRESIATLALDPANYVLPEVRSYGERCTHPKERERLVRLLRELPHLAQRPGSIYLADRVHRVRTELEWLAYVLASPIAIEPASVVACRRLLSHGSESGLYNPSLAEDEIHLALRRIRLRIVANDTTRA